MTAFETDLGRALPCPGFVDQRLRRLGNRRRRLVDQAIRVARFSLPVPHHAGRGVPAALGHRTLIGIDMCAGLSEQFSSLERSNLRLAFEALALVGCGLFVAELVRNRRLTNEAQERLKALVETSPAAIVTIDDRGFIELANRAAIELLEPRESTLLGTPIAAFLPELHHAIRWEEAPQFRASMQCRGHKGTGESFTADVWFSTYKGGLAPKVAAIIADVSEESTNGGPSGSPTDAERAVLNGREADVLRFLVQGMANKEIAGRLEISESSVKNALQQLFSKTGVAHPCPIGSGRAGAVSRPIMTELLSNHWIGPLINQKITLRNP